VPGEERDPQPVDLAYGERRRGLAEGRVNVNFLDIVQERIEAGASEDPDADGLGHLFDDSFFDEVEDPLELDEESLCLAPWEPSFVRLEDFSADFDWFAWLDDLLLSVE
jgi:hypothetical protein